MSSQRPFVDYYETLGRTPVAQDVTDFQRHLERRTSLYRALGIPPRFFALAEVLEFGPGSGHNALHVAALRPVRHVLVEGSAAGTEQVRQTLERHLGRDAERIEVVRAMAQAYDDDRPFDIVLAENLVPMQSDPADFCRRLAAHVRPGGAFVTTCMTAASTMGENLRRVVALKVAPPSLPVSERIERLRPVFGPHLATLPGVSRSVDDWIADNVTHPLDGKFFSIEDAIRALGDRFDVYGSSPDFLVDWRWYKQLYGDVRAFNERAIEQYRAGVPNLLDWRVDLGPQDAAVGQRLERSCAELFWRTRAMETGGDADLAELAGRCAAIASELEAMSPRTAAAFAEVAAFLASAENDWERAFDSFVSYFGRGVQYVSFLRR